MPEARQKISRDEALRRLATCEEMDSEMGHADADEVLLSLIADPEIEAAYERSGGGTKWYA